jgi:holo-[acyl-carrier protein] synthase
LIYGTGTDIIEVERVADQIAKIEGFREKIFTRQEIGYCESKRYKAQHYAVRYAAKEAFFKALGTGWRDGMEYIDIEINNDELGKPDIVLHGKAKAFADQRSIIRIFVSLSHIKSYATATVILEK